MILQKLKEETAHHHARLEKRVDVFSHLLSRHHYYLLLRDFYGYYAPLEARLLDLRELKTHAPDYRDRLKTPLLERDLYALGATGLELRSLPFCSDLPDLGDVARALGCMYVLEGATLGGQVISRHVGKHLGLDREYGAAFFNSYGAQVGSMWRAFGDALAGYAVSPEIEREVIAAAQETFTKFDLWLSQKEVST